jgi:hypothetical protein
MNFQQYCKTSQELSEVKSNLYTLAGHKLSQDDKAGAQAVYSQIDEIDAELSALENPQDELLTGDEEWFEV